jgi:hypothetical protein
MKRVGRVTRMSEDRNAYRAVVGKSETGTTFKTSVDGSIVLKWILHEIRWFGLDQIHLALNRDAWQAVVIAIMKVWCLHSAENIFVSGRVFSLSMELLTLISFSELLFICTQIWFNFSYSLVTSSLITFIYLLAGNVSQTTCRYI